MAVALLHSHFGPRTGTGAGTGNSNVCGMALALDLAQALSTAASVVEPSARGERELASELTRGWEQRVSA